MVKVNRYVPTEEQVNAAKTRREAQQAEKEARRNKAGSKSVKTKDGTYKSVTVTENQVEAKRHQRELAKAKENNRYGGRTIFDKKTGQYVSQSAEETKTLSEAKKLGNSGIFSKIKSGFKKTGKSISNSLTKISKGLKGKGGKIGLIATGAAFLIGGAAYLIDKLTGNSNNTPSTLLNEEPVETPISETDEKDKQVKPDPNPGEEKKEKEVQKDYVVKKGDNVWNIAKQHLKDMNTDPNYKPTDAEILKHTKELMDLNKLEFEADGYHVMIKPDEKLKLVA